MGEERFSFHPYRSQKQVAISGKKNRTGCVKNTLITKRNEGISGGNGPSDGACSMVLTVAPAARGVGMGGHSAGHQWEGVDELEVGVYRLQEGRLAYSIIIRRRNHRWYDVKWVMLSDNQETYLIRFWHGYIITHGIVYL